MIPKDKKYRLIKIYMYICDMYEQSLKWKIQCKLPPKTKAILPP